MTETLRSNWDTANERFKHSFERVFWASLIVAAMSHFALFQFFPTLEADDLTRVDPKPPIEVIPRYDVPPPPPEIERPAIPIPGDVDVAEITARTTLDANPVSEHPPPAEARADEAATGFLPYTVKPELRDRRGALRIVEREYPDLARDAGLAGTVTVQARVDTLGRVVEARVLQSSGVRLLDEAALAAVLQFEFTPALNRDRKVSVWVQQRISFRSR